MFRIIFDRCSFNGDNFGTLLRFFQTKGRPRSIRFCCTSRFIEETLQYLPANPIEVKRQMDFLYSFDSTRWFRPSSDIERLELSGANLDPRYYYLKPEKKSWEENYAYFVSGHYDKIGFNEAIDVWKKIDATKEQFRKDRIEARRNVRHGNYDFKAYVAENMEFYIRTRAEVLGINPDSALNIWQNDPGRCKFTALRAKTFFSTGFLPTTNHNIAVHKNDLTDAEQLSYLLWADIMVSDDTKFMWECFDLVFPKTGKRFMKLGEFLTFVEAHIVKHATEIARVESMV